jgi:hypothetical protein
VSDTETDRVPSFAEVRAEAGLPNVVTAADLIDKVIVVLEWEPAQATVPETNKITEGFQVTCEVELTKEIVTWFCGQEVLVKALKAVRPPFRTVIRKPGRTYLFT